MKFKVYECGTDKDVTDDKAWYIDIDGNLLYWTDSNDDAPLYIANGIYYYKLEIEVL